MDDAWPRGTGARSAARGGRRLTGIAGSKQLQDALGLAGQASPGEIKARYRSLALRCRDGSEARDGDLERLEHASLALAQELGHLGHDQALVEAILVAEGCPDRVAATVARASAGLVSRVVPEPLERGVVRPEDAAYARLAERLITAESMRTATASSHGFGFVIRLAIAFVVAMVALVSALDFFPRVLRPKAEARPPTVYPVELLPPSGKSERR